MQCPCNPTKKYSNCCQKAHHNINSVTSAEVLMRSRYSAFVLANIEYLKKATTLLPDLQNKRKERLKNGLNP